MLSETQRVLRCGGQLWLMGLCHDGSANQALLGRFGGLSFSDETELDVWLPQMQCVGGWRRGNVVFRHWIKL